MIFPHVSLNIFYTENMFRMKVTDLNMIYILYDV
jgi:hypothetical protein